MLESPFIFSTWTDYSNLSLDFPQTYRLQVGLILKYSTRPVDSKYLTCVMTGHIQYKYEFLTSKKITNSEILAFNLDLT